MRNLVTAPIRASRHLAIWLVWQSTGVTLWPCSVNLEIGMSGRFLEGLPA